MNTQERAQDTGSAEVDILSSKLFDPKERFLHCGCENIQANSVGRPTREILFGPLGPLVSFHHGVL